MTELLDEALRGDVAGIRLFDTHEHLPAESARIAARPGVLDLLHYVRCDLVSAGLPAAQLARIADAQAPALERWRLFAPAWPLVRHTAYGRAFQRALRDVHGVAELNDVTFPEADERVRAWPVPGCYRRVLCEMAGIRVAIKDTSEPLDADGDGDLFLRAYRIDGLLLARTAAEVDAYCRREVRTWDEVGAALRELAEELRRHHVVCFKVGVAYQRSLDFGADMPADIEVLYRRLRERGLADDPPAALRFGNAVFHLLCTTAAAVDLPVQIHTGLHAGGNNRLDQVHPLLLNPVFLRHRETTFDIFHAGYPWGRTVGALAKEFGNVYADLAWMHVISQEASRDLLREWIDLLPANKILGFGGDYTNVESAYAHAMMAREDVVAVLSRKLRDGFLGLDEARFLARRLLHDNAAELFGRG